MRRDGKCVISAETSGNAVVVAATIEVQCQKWDDAQHQYREWEPCETKPLPNGKIGLLLAHDVCAQPPCAAQGQLRHADKRFDTALDSAGRATIDLSDFQPNSAFATDHTAQVIVYGKSCTDRSRTPIDLSAAPLYATWQEATVQRTAQLATRRDAVLQEQDKTQAARDRQKTECEHGSAEACFALGQSLSTMSLEAGGAFNPGVAYLRRACDLKYQQACVTIAGLRDAKANRAAEADAAVAARELEPFKERCTRKDQAACLLLGFASKCQQGISEGCDSMGNAYVGGVGVSKDLARTKTYWLRACDIEPRRCIAYGVKFQSTPAFAGSEQTAQEFYDRACRGDAEQCAIVGVMYRDGKGGVPRDASKARSYFDRGCKAGAPTSCRSLNGI
jgi:hypothetical protein